MTLETLKKEFMEIAVRYGSKDYLTSQYRNYLFDGFCSVNNTIGSKNHISYSFSKYIQEIFDAVTLFHKVRDYELKAFLIHEKEFCRTNNISRMHMMIYKSEIVVETYKEVEFNFEDGEAS